MRRLRTYPLKFSHFMGSFIAIAIMALFYFIPAIAAQGKRNAVAIFWLNLLAGWTIIGWIGALIWAVSKDASPVTIVQQVAPATPVVAPKPTAAMATRTATTIPSPSPVPVATMVTVAPPAAAKPATVNIADELERLFQLKEKGALTEEEYTVHKAKLLA